MPEDAGVRRFQVIEEPPLSPGADYVTKTNIGPFIDTGVWVGLGMNRQRLYLAKDTIFEMAECLDLFDQVREHGEKRYHDGYNDAVKENLGGDLRDIADRIGAVLPYLAGLAGDSAPVGAESPEGSEPAGGPLEDEAGRDQPFVVDSVESIAKRTTRTRGQGNGSGSDERPAGVPAGAGDDSAFRI